MKIKEKENQIKQNDINKKINIKREKSNNDKIINIIKKK